MLWLSISLAACYSLQWQCYTMDSFYSHFACLSGHQFHWSENEIPLQDIRHHVIGSVMFIVLWSRSAGLVDPLLHSLFTPFLSLSVQPWETQTEKRLKEIFVSRVLIALLTRYQHNSNITHIMVLYQLLFWLPSHFYWEKNFMLNLLLFRKCFKIYQIFMEYVGSIFIPL